MNKDVTKRFDNLRNAWLSVFPKSAVSVRATAKDGVYNTDNTYFAGSILDVTDFPHGMFSNDPLSFTFVVDENGYSEKSLTLSTGECFCYDGYSKADSVSMELLYMENPTFETITKRFVEIKEFLVKNKDNMFYDISGKL